MKMANMPTLTIYNGHSEVHHNTVHIKRTGTLDVTRDGTIVLKLDGAGAIRGKPGDKLTIHHDTRVGDGNDISIVIELSIPKHED